MIDFTSSVYLGFRHPSAALAPWGQLTTGVPAALGVPAAAHRVAAAFAELQGCQAALLARSTLHAFVDLFATVVERSDGVLIDAGAYPLARWALSARAGPLAEFAHHDPEHLAVALAHRRFRDRAAVVLTDGWCPGCGRVAPLAAYLDVVRGHGGRLVLDDTQAIGVLGVDAGPAAPYGRGGGGSLAWARVGGPDVVVVSSLAKGFGAPIAVTAGAAEVVSRIENHGPTQSHSSPPSMADLHAAERVLVANSLRGEHMRRRLWGLVNRLRRRARQFGVRILGGSMPVQSLAPMGLDAALAIHDALVRYGINTVVQQPRCRRGSTVTFLVTARHRADEMDLAADALGEAVARQTRDGRALNAGAARSR